MEHQYFHVSHVAPQLRANLHRIGHLVISSPVPTLRRRSRRS
jgi:hypothetical protein